MKHGASVGISGYAIRVGIVGGYHCANEVLAGTLHVLQWWHWVCCPHEEESGPRCLALLLGFSICLTTLLLLVGSMAPSSIVGQGW